MVLILLFFLLRSVVLADETGTHTEEDHDALWTCDKEVEFCKEHESGECFGATGYKMCKECESGHELTGNSCPGKNWLDLVIVAMVHAIIAFLFVVWPEEWLPKGYTKAKLLGIKLPKPQVQILETPQKDTRGAPTFHIHGQNTTPGGPPLKSFKRSSKKFGSARKLKQTKYGRVSVGTKVILKNLHGSNSQFNDCEGVCTGQDDEGRVCVTFTTKHGSTKNGRFSRSHVGVMDVNVTVEVVTDDDDTIYADSVVPHGMAI